MNLNLRNSPTDGVQRMLSALEPGMELPIHWNMKSSEAVVFLRGHKSRIVFNNARVVTEGFDIGPGEHCLGLSISKGQWHTVEVLGSGTVVLEGKDGAHEPIKDDDAMTNK